MKIVTGYTGTPHITANEAQSFHQGILGSGNYILNVGNMFSATLVSAENVTVQDGEGVMQGVHFRIDPGQTESVTISPGTPGYNRIDLICARYTKDAGTGIESVDLVVIEGTPAAGAASQPEYNTGNIRTGALIADYPLYKVTLSGLTPALQKLTKTCPQVSDIANMIYPIGSIYMSVNSTNPTALFGGTWVAWGAGRVPVGVNTGDASFDTVEKTGGEKTHTLTINEMPSHYHTSYFPMPVEDANLSQGGAGNNGISINPSGSSGTSDAGGGQAHNILQPYITCYMWKRTA